MSKACRALFHLDAFERVPEVFFAVEPDGRKRRGEAIIAPRGSSKSTHFSLGACLYAIVMKLEDYILEICDVCHAGRAFN
ncbi:MAG: hypothetical protein U5K75_02405 [Ahrensia sp.]|nr:hypothetical protein [Ahrensia sp.]